MGGRGGGLYASQCSTLSTTLSTPPARRQYHGVLRPTPPYLKRNTIGSSIITSQVCRRKVCRNFTGMFQMAGSLLLGLWVVNGFVGGASWATHVAPCSMEYPSGILVAETVARPPQWQRIYFADILLFYALYSLFSNTFGCYTIKNCSLLQNWTA